MTSHKKIKTTAMLQMEFHGTALCMLYRIYIIM